jgi:endo-1,4-beta-xylanase
MLHQVRQVTTIVQSPSKGSEGKHGSSRKCSEWHCTIMNRLNRTVFSSQFFIAVASLIISSCAGGGEGTTTPLPDPLPPPVINVPNLYLLAPMSMTVGVAVQAGRSKRSLLKSTGRQTIVNHHFSQLTAANIMKPRHLHPAESTFFFDDADALVDYAASQDKTVHGHTLIWHNRLPNWMNNFTGNEVAWTAMMTDHITVIASHFAAGDIVVSWDVVNEAFTDTDNDRDGLNDLRNTIWHDNIGAGYLAAAYRAANAADPNADLYYNDYNISGVRAKLNAVLDLVDQFQNDPNPVPIHGIGFQMHISLTWPDIDQIRESFALAVDTGLKIKISELDIAVNTDRSRKPLSLPEFTDAVAVQQQERFEAIVAAYMDEVPEAQRGGITVWGIADLDNWLRRYNALEWPLLFDDDLEPKPALQGFADGLTGDT